MDDGRRVVVLFVAWPVTAGGTISESVTVSVSNSDDKIRFMATLTSEDD
jgi:hypothetical protein